MTSKRVAVDIYLRKLTFKTLLTLLSFAFSTNIIPPEMVAAVKPEL